MASIQRILCPVDVEKPSLPALRAGLALARCFHAEVDALHVREGREQAPFQLFSSRVDDVEKLMRAHDVRQRFDEMLRSVSASDDARAEVISGSPAPAILAHALEKRSDLIVLGSRSRTALPWQYAAGISDELATQAICPVLTVPELAAPSFMRHILLPVDFSTATVAATRWAAAIARRFESSVAVLHALPTTRSLVGRQPSPDLTRTALAHSLVRLREIEASLRRGGVRSTSSVLVESRTLDAILAHNQADTCDLVVMGMHHRAEERRNPTAGMVSSVRNHVAVPVLSVRSSEPSSVFVGGGSVARRDSDSWVPLSASARPS